MSLCTHHRSGVDPKPWSRITASVHVVDGNRRVAVERAKFTNDAIDLSGNCLIIGPKKSPFQNPWLPDTIEINAFAAPERETFCVIRFSRAMLRIVDSQRSILRGRRKI